MNRIFAIISLVAFVILAVIALTSAHVDSNVQDVLFYGGLAALAAAHL